MKYWLNIDKYHLNISLTMKVSVKDWLSIVYMSVMINLEKGIGKDPLNIS